MQPTQIGTQVHQPTSKGNPKLRLKGERETCDCEVCVYEAPQHWYLGSVVSLASMQGVKGREYLWVVVQESPENMTIDTLLSYIIILDSNLTTEWSGGI